MGLVATSGDDEIDRAIAAYVARLEKAIFERLYFIGEAFIKEAREKVGYDEAFRNEISSIRAIANAYGGKTSLQDNISSSSPSFRDDTGALRSSIGFAIYRNGEEMSNSFPNSGVVKKGSEGKKTGATLVKEIASGFPNGIALVVVAGMQYAAAVESRGYDVITGGSLNAETAFKNLKKDIVESLKNIA